MAGPLPMEGGVTRVESVVRPSSARLAWLHVLLGLALIAVFCLGPEWVQTPVSAVVMVLGRVPLHTGPRRNLAPADRLPWQLIRVAGYLFIVARVIRALVPVTMATPITAISLLPIGFVLPAYLCIGFAFS